LNGRVAAVLGVGPGLGSSVARRFASEGFAVALMARGEESVAGAREEIEDLGGTALPVSIDATAPASVSASFGRVREELGDPEVFVYNAGAFQMGGILEIEPEKFDECFRANCAGGL
jgi:NAD(P)-dependent dehydrogenase (short-subunit alcohol dehydrogenase family)